MTRADWNALLVASPILAFVAWASVARLREVRRITRSAAARWRDRVPMADCEFLRRCRVPDELSKVDVALTIRRAVARKADVPAEMICPEDRLDRDYLHLFRDGFDPVELIMEIEEEIDLSIHDYSLMNTRILAGGRYSDVRVKHLVQGVVAEICQTEKAVLDDEW